MKFDLKKERVKTLLITCMTLRIYKSIHCNLVSPYYLDHLRFIQEVVLLVKPVLVHVIIHFHQWLKIIKLQTLFYLCRK